MSTTASRAQRIQAGHRAKAFARQMLRYHIPVRGAGRTAFAALYRFHVAMRSAVAWAARFFWYEPLFRSQCADVGERFVMEQLPYLVGRGVVRIGSDVQFSGKPSFLFSARHSDSPRLVIGDGCFLGHNCAITVGREVKIGAHCLIAGGVRIADFDGHPMDALERRSGKTSSSEDVSPVTIGDDVWLGHGAVILKGVQIGDRAIIGARAVVTRDVQPDTVVAGNPARVIKTLKPS